MLVSCPWLSAFCCPAKKPFSKGSQLQPRHRLRGLAGRDGVSWGRGGFHYAHDGRQRQAGRQNTLLCRAGAQRNGWQGSSAGRNHQYTTMVGKKTTLKVLRKELHARHVTAIRTTELAQLTSEGDCLVCIMVISCASRWSHVHHGDLVCITVGKTSRWAIAWSFAVDPNLASVPIARPVNPELARPIVPKRSVTFQLKVCVCMWMCERVGQGYCTSLCYATQVYAVQSWGQILLETGGWRSNRHLSFSFCDRRTSTRQESVIMLGRNKYLAGTSAHDPATMRRLIVYSGRTPKDMWSPPPIARPSSRPTSIPQQAHAVPNPGA
eukprot:1158903-Pelagomonas_calceolata.AAC.14